VYITGLTSINKKNPSGGVDVCVVLYEDNSVEHNWYEKVGKDFEVQNGSKEETGRRKKFHRRHRRLSLVSV
jgi:hypothetical protein